MLVQHLPQDTTRTPMGKRDARLTVMSGALDLFRTRRANLARRDRLMARDMRWAGEESRFCIAEFKARVAWSTQQREAHDHIRASELDLIARMKPEAREHRIRAVLEEIERLPYAPLGIHIKGRQAALEAELADLRAAHFPLSADVVGTGNRVIAIVSVLAAEVV